MRHHVMWSTYGSWLPGDPRGFRTRHHRQHVEGDYRNPPPAGAYDGLHAYSRGQLKRPPVVLPADLRAEVGQAVLAQFAKEDVRVFRLSVGGQHVHAAIDCLPEDLKPIIGRVKKVSSHRIRQRIPGTVWAAGGKLVPARTEEHWRNVLQYITNHGPNAWVWQAE